MTLFDIRDVITEVDPKASHYAAPDNGDLDYTVWQEYKHSSFALDDAHAGGWSFMVFRVTRKEYDPIVDKLEQAFDEADISWNHEVEYEHEYGIIIHTFRCEAV